MQLGISKIYFKKKKESALIMRKQTKLVAVLSAAALLAIGASMTSFAAGWQKSDDGTWQYYDSDDEMVTDEWKKDGAKWFYLDEDGNMVTDAWVDDDYYVAEDGSMLINAWKKTMADDEEDDPDDGGEHWYYFGTKGKKIVDDSKKIGGKTYYFDEDGEMRYGWYDGDGEGYYLGDEDDGARTESAWLWLEKSGLLDDDDDEEQDKVLACDEDDDCDDEGWYWFQSSGKLYNAEGKKKINGKYYMFNDHGQMLYEWINGSAVTVGSNAQLDGIATAGSTKVQDMRYYNAVEEGWRANGWYEIDGAEDVGTDGDTDWYYVDDGEIKYADGGTKDYATNDDDGAVYVQRMKLDGKYFAINEKGQMQDGLQFCADDDGFYYFDENGYQKTGKVSNVECDDDDYNFYFNTTNGKSGQGYKGNKDDYLYFNGKRLEADDDYRLYLYEGDVYLVNTKGKIQKSSKKYDIENKGISADDVDVVISGKKVKTVGGVDVNKYVTEVYDALVETGKTNKNGFNVVGDVTEDMKLSVPFIQLYDDDIYTYNKITTGTDSDGNTTYAFSEGWMGINKK